MLESETVITAIIGGIVSIAVAIVAVIRTRQTEKTSILTDLVGGISTLQQDNLALNDKLSDCQESREQERIQRVEMLELLEKTHKTAIAEKDRAHQIELEAHKRELTQLYKDYHRVRKLANGKLHDDGEGE